MKYRHVSKHSYAFITHKDGVTIDYLEDVYSSAVLSIAQSSTLLLEKCSCWILLGCSKMQSIYNWHFGYLTRFLFTPVYDGPVKETFFQVWTAAFLSVTVCRTVDHHQMAVPFAGLLRYHLLKLWKASVPFRIKHQLVILLSAICFIVRLLTSRCRHSFVASYIMLLYAGWCL